MAGGKESTRRTATCYISFSIPRQARCFSNTVRCLKVRSATVWQLLRDSTGQREGNGTDGLIRQHPAVPSHVSLKRKEQAEETCSRHTQTLQCFSFLLLAFGYLVLLISISPNSRSLMQSVPTLAESRGLFQRAKKEKKKKRKKEKQ